MTRLEPTEENVVAMDARTGVQTIFFPLKYPNGEEGLLIIGRLPEEHPWDPKKSIKSITIEFHEPENKDKAGGELPATRHRGDKGRSA